MSESSTETSLSRLDLGIAQQPRQLWRDRDLSIQAKALYAWITSHKPGFKWTNSFAANSLGCSEKTVKKYLRELEKRGWIERDQDREKGQFGTRKIYVNPEPITVGKKTPDGSTVGQKTAGGFLPHKEKTTEERKDLRETTEKRSNPPTKESARSPDRKEVEESIIPFEKRIDIEEFKAEFRRVSRRNFPESQIPTLLGFMRTRPKPIFDKAFEELAKNRPKIPHLYLFAILGNSVSTDWTDATPAELRAFARKVVCEEPTNWEKGDGYPVFWACREYLENTDPRYAFETMQEHDPRRPPTPTTERSEDSVRPSHQKLRARLTELQVERGQ